MTAAYLATLNPQQRRAVEHGCDKLDEASPLLIIAGAGSGKTNTLAHRVTHLTTSGADPRRMMLLTFSRRAAWRRPAADQENDGTNGSPPARRAWRARSKPANMLVQP
jgi:superfamily I DNA/RNA helicase